MVALRATAARLQRVTEPARPLRSTSGSNALATKAARLTEARAVSVALAKFFVVLAVLWIVFYAAYRKLPYIQNGSDVVYNAKERFERAGALYPATVPADERLLIFGNSKVLSGFIPSLFDSLVTQEAGARAYSFNLGKPDATHFVGDLKLLIESGQTPRTILLTVPWATSGPEGASLFRFLREDSEIMTRLFPFRRLPRDLALFFLRARTRGGPAAFYRYGSSVVRRIQADRGYYFIEGQSHYPSDRLPDDLRFDSDRGDTTWGVDFIPAGPEFTQLDALAERHGIQIYIVPMYARIGEVASAGDPSPNVARMAGHSRFTVVGPQYFVFPNRFFSDPVHLNPDGARVYTSRLAELMAPLLRTVR